jgi:DNA uptake protein ComE-like DNA-binding protein
MTLASFRGGEPMSRSDRILVAALGVALVLVAAAGWILIAPAEAGPEVADDALLLGSPSIVGAPTEPPASGTIVVDVEGAVVEPGVRELPAGARVADAINAAGGYASDADLDATASALNLAQALADGEQIHVPRIGEAAAAVASGAAGAATGGSTAGGLLDLNTATPEELEALPGIGPVTVQKIVAARQEQPFASLDDAVQRGVLNRGQADDIRELATAG